MFSHQLFGGNEAFSEGTCSATHALSSESACNTCLKTQRLSDLVDPFPHPVEKERKKSRRQKMEQHGQHKYRYQRRQRRDYQKGFAFGVPTMFPRFQTSSGFSHPPNPDQSCFWQPRVLPAVFAANVAHQLGVPFVPWTLDSVFVLSGRHATRKLFRCRQPT